MRQALLCVLLAFALVQASPTRKAPSRVAKRAGPSPSHYPGKDSPECANEPLYLNFDITKDGDKNKVQKIHDVFCNEFNALTMAGNTATQDKDQTIYKRFFPENDQDDKYQDSITDVWNKLFDFGAKTPSKLVSTFIIDNVDWKKACGETAGADPTDSEDLEQGAYTAVDDADNREKTHFCNAVLEENKLSAITCNTLDSYPSAQMDTTGRVMLHEFTHYTTVGPKSKLNAQIVDAKNEDTHYSYYPSRAHGLVDPKQDDNPELASVNANNYAWISTNSYFKQKCPKGPNGNYNNPPNYKKGQSGDPSSNGKGDNPGDNGCGTSNAPGCNGTPDNADPFGPSATAPPSRVVRPAAALLPAPTTAVPRI